ncbi:MAG: cobalt-precorrin 5A hydrolase [Selenomonadaceae bacterium]|nr:cobalt-precorrin 5A hydrolase [Selenomonadaceae bacterium]
MRIAILTVTDAGFKLAEKINCGQIFCKGRDFDSLKNFVAEVFNKFDALIFICATGIAVRMIAPHILSKLSDPAVIVIDERGQNVISLLSGHVGGANELTLKIAEAINSNPVITTATDVENKFAADSFAAKLGLIPTPKTAIKAINAAVLRDEPVYLTAGNVTLNLIPQKLIAGIGCKRGTSTEKISAAVTAACEMINQPVERIKILASVDIKSDEGGLLEFAKNLGVEIKFFSVEELAKKITEYKLSESNFVKDTLGIGNICEAAALCCVESARFALPKKNFDGVTVALIFEKI